MLTIETRTLDLSGARIIMGQVILREGQELASAKVEAALVNADGRPRRFPKDWIKAFQPTPKAS